MKIHIISSEDACDIVTRPKDSEHGLFLVNHSHLNPPHWIAIDNTTGNAFAKKFKSKEEAEKWLSDGIV